MNISSVIAGVNDFGARNKMNVPERERDRAISKNQRGEDLTILEKIQKKKFDNEVEKIVEQGRNRPNQNNQKKQASKKKQNTYSYEERDKSVSYGDKGKKVEEAQKVLKEAGYLEKDADGKFDYDTLIGMKKFLEDMNATDRYDNIDFNVVDDNMLKALKDPFKNEK